MLATTRPAPSVSGPVSTPNWGRRPTPYETPTSLSGSLAWALVTSLCFLAWRGVRIFQPPGRSSTCGRFSSPGMVPEKPQYSSECPSSPQHLHVRAGLIYILTFPLSMLVAWGNSSCATNSTFLSKAATLAAET